jgi:hypothetical protein
MTKKRIVKQLLSTELLKAKGVVETLAQKIEAEQTSIDEARSRVRELKEDLVCAQHEFQRLEELSIIETGLPPNIIALRNEILAKKKEAERTDITINRRDFLEGEIKQLTKKLSKSCPHTFVFSYNGYGGDRDGDGAYSELRVCAVCGLEEESEYQVLADSYPHLVKRDWENDSHFKKRFNRPSIWRPFETLIEMFKSAAGRRNIEWPKEEEKKEKMIKGGHFRQ